MMNAPPTALKVVTPLRDLMLREWAQRLMLAAVGQGLSIADAQAFALEHSATGAETVQQLAELVEMEIRESAQRLALQARQPRPLAN